MSYQYHCSALSHVDVSQLPTFFTTLSHHFGLPISFRRFFTTSFILEQPLNDHCQQVTSFALKALAFESHAIDTRSTPPIHGLDDPASVQILQGGMFYHVLQPEVVLLLQRATM